MWNMHQHGGDIYRNKAISDFSVNINLSGTPESVMEAACRGVRSSFRYPDTRCQDLRKAISESAGIPAEEIICGNGAADLIYSLVLAARPEKALVPAPSFFEYGQALRAMGCTVVCHYMKEENGFALGEDFLQAITPDIGIVFLCNPNNPTGTLIDKGLMERIIKRCEEHHVLLAVDECFMDFAEDAAEYSVMDIYGRTETLFVLKAFTKLYAMPGLRLGYGFCRDMQLLEKMKEVSQPWSVSIPAQEAGIAALKETEYVKRSLEILKKEKAFLLEGLDRLGLKVYGSAANYLFFRAGEGLFEKCLEKGFLIRDCGNYEGLSEGYYRIAVKTHEENELFLKALGEVV